MLRLKKKKKKKLKLQENCHNIYFKKFQHFEKYINMRLQKKPNRKRQFKNDYCLVCLIRRRNVFLE